MFIRRLSVRGIRNFDNEETIYFTCPMTVIFGSNDTEKTAIIEALEFVITGEFPPNSEEGRYFLYDDPKLETTSSVRGIVEAEIVDSTDNIYTVRRTIELHKSNALKTFTTMTKMSEDKEPSISSQRPNVDVELSVALGISKSILNYVMFCHQDELNWPFDTEKLLKRFDEILGSTKYNKILNNITMICNKLQGDLQGMNAEKQMVFLLMSEVEAKFEEQKKRLESTKEKIDSISEKQQYETHKSHLEHENIMTKKEKKEIEYNMCRVRCEELKETEQNVFEETIEELNARLQSHQMMLMKKKNDEITENEAEIQSICREEARILNILATRRATVGTLKQQMKDHEKRVIQCNQLLRNALQACSFNAVRSDISEIEVKIFIKKLEEKMRTLEQEVKEDELTMQRQEKKLQKKVDKLCSNCSQIRESEKFLKEKEIIEIRDEITAIYKQKFQETVIGEIENKLKFLEQKLQAKTQQIEDFDRKLDIDCVKTDIKNNIKSIDEIGINLDLFDEEISSLHKLSSITAEFELHKSTLQAKKEELQNLRNKYEYDIKVLLNIHELSETTFKNLNLNSIRQQLEEEINSLTREIQMQERKSTILETTVQYIKSDIEEKRMEIKHDEHKISIVCDYNNFEKILLMQSEIVQDLQNKRAIYVDRITIYKKYIENLSLPSASCSLCHRRFRYKNKKLIEEIENSIINNQSNRLKCEEELKTQQESYNNMLQLKPIVENISCQKNKLKKLDEKLEETQNNLVHTKSHIMKLETSKAEKKLSLCKNIIGDIEFFDWCIYKTQRELEQIIDNFQIQIANAGIEVEGVMKKAQKRRDQLNVSFKEAHNHIEMLQDKLNNGRLQAAKAVYNKLHEQQLQIQSEKIKHPKDKQEDLYTREVSVEKLRENLTHAEDQLNSRIRRLEKTKTKNWQEREVEKKLISENAIRLLDLHSIIDEIDTFNSSDVLEKLTNYEREIEIYQNSLTEYASKKKDVEQTINKLKIDITNLEIEKRELIDNITLCGIKEKTDEKTLKEQYEQLSAKLKNMHYSEMPGKLGTLKNEQQALHDQKILTLGSQEEHETIIQQYTQKLQKEENLMARRNYTDKCIELPVYEETIANLKAHCEELDVAMLDYHEQCIAAVNKIMKKFWKYVYKDTDTTSIRISVESTKDVGSSRKIYHYKLVQTKQGREMDMKGHCSAVQEVLASLITRLALAETFFYKDCGTFVLNEPTINLDEESANSMVDMLNKVVELQSSRQKNFQLIIITCNKNFAQKLANLNHKKF